MSPYVLAFLIGVIAGLRSMTRAGRGELGGAAGLAAIWRTRGSRSWASRITPYILTVLALGELIADKLPKTPSRKALGPFVVRIVTGALCGAALGAASGGLMGGLIAGALGGVAGTLGGYEFRARLVKAIGGKDLPIALLEDVIAIGGAIWIVVMSTAFDAIVIGTGQAGPFLTRRLAASGMKVAIIERKLFGGTCVNTGCIPTKTMVASAYAAHMARRAADFGVRIDGAVSVDMRQVKARKDEISGQSRTGLESSLKKLENCTVYEGHARFESPREVSVGAERLTADRIFINVGATRDRAGDAGSGADRLSDQQLHDGRRFSSQAFDYRRRQLYRAGVRADVPAIWERGHDHRDGSAAGAARR